jgi:hypothetical protein
LVWNEKFRLKPLNKGYNKIIFKALDSSGDILGKTNEVQLEDLGTGKTQADLTIRSTENRT